VRNYEIAIVLHPDLEIDIESATSKVEKIIDLAKGKVTKKDNWGKRKLAYPIKKQDWGIYVFYNVQLDPSAVAQIENTLRITEEVMRYLIVSLENTRLVSKTNQQNTEPDSKESDKSQKEAITKEDK
jgi:small subunit ribosomal protein S6